jgi:trigger factor
VLNTSVERLEGIKVKLTVTVPAEQVDESVDRAYKAVAGKVKIPGFRPGKAPRPMIDNVLGRDYVLAEATEDLVNTTYPLALDAERLRPIESPEMEELESVEPGKDYTYEAEIETRPELTVSSIADISVAMPEREATQEEIDAQLTVARERFATLEPVEDRGVAVDDFVLLSFVGTVDGEPYEGNEVDKYLYEMSRGLMPVEFDAGIIGATPGEERSVKFDIPESSSNPEFVGKTAGFEITVHEIKAKRLPEIDDEFAANVGGFDSVDDMYADLKTRIDLQKGIEYDRLKERKVRELLAERLEGDIPQAMIDSRHATMMRDFMAMLDTRQIPIDQYLAATGIDMDTVESDILAQSTQSIREDLALEALFRQQGMEVSDDDIEAELSEIAQATEAPIEDARKRWEELGLMPVISEQIMHRKAIQWLMDNAEVTLEQPPVEEPAVAEAAPAEKRASKKAPEDESTEE